MHVTQLKGQRLSVFQVNVLTSDFKQEYNE